MDSPQSISATAAGEKWWWRFPSYGVLLAAFLLLVPWLGLKDFHTRGEAREALVAQDMVRRGEWILPSGYGGVVPSKPPMTHWLMAVTSKVTGNLDEFAARFPSALCAVLFLVLFSSHLHSRVDRRAALIVPLLVLTSVEWFRAATATRVDMVFSALLGTALLLLYQWSERQFRGIPLGGVVALGGAILAKGPVALILAGGIFWSFILLQGAGVRKLARVAVLVFAPALLLALSWYLLGYLERGAPFLDKIYDENIARFSGTMDDDPHRHSALFLLLMLWVGLLPWSGASLLLLHPRNLLHRAVPKFPSFAHVISLVRAVSPWRCFCAVATVVVVFFFCLPASKRGVYLLPAYPFIVALGYDFAVRRAGALWERSRDIGGWIFALIGAGLAVVPALIMVLPWEALFKGSLLAQLEFARDALALMKGWQGGVLVLAAAGVIWLGVRVRRAGLIGQALLICGALSVTLFPPFGAILSERKVADTLRTLSPQGPIASFDFEFYGTSFYLDAPMMRLEDHIPEEGMMVIAFERSLDDLRRILPAELRLDVLKTTAPHVVKPFRRVAIAQIARENGDSPN